MSFCYASLSRVSHHLPEQASKLLKGRVQIINVWRLIKPIFKDLIGVVDTHSVPDSDLVVQALIYPSGRGETYALRPNEGCEWCYSHGQTPDEVSLIKCFDSKKDRRARRVPHITFANSVTEDREVRDSIIEIRVLLFHEDHREWEPWSRCSIRTLIQYGT